jgi:hypothetical protein
MMLDGANCTLTDFKVAAGASRDGHQAMHKTAARKRRSCRCWSADRADDLPGRRSSGRTGCRSTMAVTRLDDRVMSGPSARRRRSDLVGAPRM